jgi:hypothetical protein
MTLKKKTTKRKFYGKWLYKITMNAPGIGILRSKSPDEAMLFLKSANTTDPRYYHNNTIIARAINNRAQLLSICSFIKDIDPIQFAKRIEQQSIDFYTNDKNLYSEFCDKFMDTIIHHFEPDDNSIALFKNQYTIVAKKFPHDKFKYKVYLKPHNLKNDIDSKQQFLDWIDNQKDKILITDTVKTWFIVTDWNWDRRYMLVDNEKTLIMLKMRSSEAVGKIYEYVISDK